MVRLLSMFITVTNVIVALLVGRVLLVVLVTMGMALTGGVANLLFALINPVATYWAFGADFVFAAGTLSLRKCVFRTTRASAARCALPEH
ncbi:uncharacterized protein B0H18DRAFT_1033511, partial [Fomitopsis serialis]|uniref:uncharacterized protein n=1 Tax=Fomitopsis serialis TaxID=139415 RepID=UPI002008D1A7